MKPRKHLNRRSASALVLILLAATVGHAGPKVNGDLASATQRETPTTLNATGLNPRQLVQLRAAKRLAARRVETRTECSALFEGLERTGPSALSAMAIDLNANPNFCERGVAATTHVSGNAVSLCRQWLPRLDRYQLAQLLIHEALHNAGLGEAPSDPDAPTSQAINRLVSKRCGL